MKIRLLFTLILIAKFVFSQTDTAATFKINGYLDSYYAYELSNPSSGDITYAYNHNRQNEFAVNNAIIDMHYKHPLFYANFGLQAGTYVVANYAPEPTLLQSIFEANVGVKIKYNLWLEMGVFTSHIGFENSISKDQWTLTRSLCAENVPYYEAGAKLTYVPNKKWILTALILNGWQNMNEENSNKAPCIQIQYIPNKKLLINYSSFFGQGENTPDSLKLNRIFHNFYGTYKFSQKWSMVALYDIGWQQKSITDLTYVPWWAANAMLRYHISDKYASCFRLEYYWDPNDIFIGAKAPGVSLNFDYAPTRNVLLRVEAKTYPAKDANGNYGEDSFMNSIFTFNMAASF